MPTRSAALAVLELDLAALRDHSAPCHRFSRDAILTQKMAETHPRAAAAELMARHIDVRLVHVRGNRTADGTWVSPTTWFIRRLVVVNVPKLKGHSYTLWPVSISSSGQLKSGSHLYFQSYDRVGASWKL
jgi:hypothetical protein